MKACIYCRVSSEDQFKEGISLEVQESRLRDYCKAKDWNIVEVYRDEGKSAFKGTRSQFERLKQDCNTNLFDVILVTRLDRMFRNMKEGINTLDEWEKLGKKFVSIVENFDTTTAMGKAFLRIALVFAELEAGTTGDRTRDTHADRVAKGIHVHRPPLGYYLKNKKWYINKEKVEIIKSIFERIANGENAKYIALDYELKLQRIYYIIKNRTYLGEVFYNKEWIKAKHTPLVDTSLFQTANSRIKKINAS